MSKFRSRWLALFGGATLIALSLSATMAHDPAGQNHATDVSGFVESQDQDAADETDSTAEPKVEAEESATEEPTTEESADDQAESEGESEADDADEAAGEAETDDADASDAGEHDGEGDGGDKVDEGSDD